MRFPATRSAPLLQQCTPPAALILALLCCEGSTLLLHLHQHSTMSKQRLTRQALPQKRDGLSNLLWSHGLCFVSKHWQPTQETKDSAGCSNTDKVTEEERCCGTGQSREQVDGQECPVAHYSLHIRPNAEKSPAVQAQVQDARMEEGTGQQPGQTPPLAGQWSDLIL